MRPNNQNKRSRGRNGGRKHSNPLSRNFESNGPDVKVRGNAAHVAEKYVQLARDAQASGDSVMAENYFQHAEHYFRIVSAAQAQAPQRNDAQAQNDSGGDDGDTNAGSGRAETKSKPSSDNRADSQGNRADANDETGNVTSDASAASEQETADPEKTPDKPRRPRRKRATQSTAGNPADAPQPDLPAFLTGAGTADAAE